MNVRNNTKEKIPTVQNTIWKGQTVLTSVIMYLLPMYIMSSHIPPSMLPKRLLAAPPPPKQLYVSLQKVPTLTVTLELKIRIKSERVASN